MKTIEKHHQPFLFYENEKIKILTSKILNQTYEISFGNSIVKENIWKLFIVDYDSLIETELTTPENFYIKGQSYVRFAECNGFVYLSNGSYKISYVVGVHNRKINVAPSYFIASGDLDVASNSVTNVVLMEEATFEWSGYLYNNYFIHNYYNNIIIDNLNDENDIKHENLDSCFDSLTRITGIWNDSNTVIVTGFNHNNRNNFKSFFYDISAKKFTPIVHNLNSLIYKCSVLTTENGVKLLAWTDKVFKTPTSSDYFLNIDVL